MWIKIKKRIRTNDLIDTYIDKQVAMMLIIIIFQIDFFNLFFFMEYGSNEQTYHLMVCDYRCQWTPVAPNASQISLRASGDGNGGGVGGISLQYPYSLIKAQRKRYFTPIFVRPWYHSVQAGPFAPFYLFILIINTHRSNSYKKWHNVNKIILIPQRIT